MRVVEAVKKHVNNVRQMQINLGSYLGHCLTNGQYIVQKTGMLFLTELFKITIVFFIPIFRDIPRVHIVVSVIGMIKLLKTWDVVASVLETSVMGGLNKYWACEFYDGKLAHNGGPCDCLHMFSGMF